MGGQVGLEIGPVRRPRLGRAKAREPQPHPARADRLEQLGEQEDQLGVDGRVGRADRLRADLPELAVAAGLRALAAEEGAEVPELHGLRQLGHPVLEVGAARRRRPLRTEGERLARPLVERVHLLLHDVGRRAHAAREELRRLEDRRLDAAVAGRLEDAARVALERLARERVVAQHVEGAARSLDPRAHREWASSRRKGLESRSRPIVVTPMCPGYTVVSSGSWSSSPPSVRMSVAVSPPGRSVRPTEPSKSTSPLNTARSAGMEYVTCPGEWPGVKRTSISSPARVSRSPP